MKSDKIIDAIGKLDDEIINQAAENWEKNKKRNKMWKSIIGGSGVAIAACFCMVIIWTNKNVKDDAGLHKKDLTAKESAVEEIKSEYMVDIDYSEQAEDAVEENMMNDGAMPESAEVEKETNEKFVVAEPIYPTEEEMEDRSENKDYEAEDEQTNGIIFKDFVNETSKRLLINGSDDNNVYAPMNIYCALSMLAEVTDGNTRKEILDVLGNKDIEAQEKMVQNMWLDNYSDDNIFKNIMANSLWLNENVQYNKDTLNKIADIYYASSFSGKMGDEAYNAEYREWLSKQTRGLLDTFVSEKKLSRDSIMTMVTTQYFSGKWDHEFNNDETASKPFVGTRGKQDVQMMHSNERTSVVETEDYKAINKAMTYGGMYIILPNENSSIDEVLNNKVLDIVGNLDVWNHAQVYDVDLLLPKFDVSADFDLKATLKDMGINEAFSTTGGDFSPLTSLEQVYVNEATHSVRVKVNEEGCEAAAITELYLKDGDGLNEVEAMDFHVDRPFIYVITGKSDQPLFVGVINNLE